MSRRFAAFAAFALLLAAGLPGCSSSPSTRLLSPDDGSGAGQTARWDPLAVGDTVAVGVPVTAALGGTASVGPYTMVVPPGGYDRNVFLHLSVRNTDGALEFGRTPANAAVLAPSVLAADLRGVPGFQLGGWAMYRWSDATSSWVRVPSSMVEPAGERLTCSVTEEGVYKAMPWTDATPNADTLVTRMAVSSFADCDLRCGGARLFLPAGALRGAGDVEMKFERAVNVVHLEIHPGELNGFSTPAQLTLDVSHLSAEDRKRAAVGWFNPQTGLWEVVANSTVDLDRATVTAPLAHFSSYTVVLEGRAGWGTMPGGGRQLTE